MLGTLGKFHTFDLARQLEARGMLKQVFTSYPWVKLKGEGIAREKVDCFPWVQVSLLLMGRLGIRSAKAARAMQWRTCESLDRHIARRMPECDVYIGLSSAGLYSGKRAQESGGLHVCDRGSAHIRVQDDLLRKEFEAAGVPYEGIDPRVIEKEEREYAQADLILTPSTFARESFIERGIAPEKLLFLPYGVDLGSFGEGEAPKAGAFDVLFVGAASFQKGTPYLLKAFRALQHSKKRLVLVGAIQAEVQALIDQEAKHGDVLVVGLQPRAQVREWMSRSHVLALPSVQDGFGLVMAEAMACGCPVVASDHTGARDLYEDGQQGFIVPYANSDALAQALQLLADNPEQRDEMARAARKVIDSIGGWNTYGETIERRLVEMTSKR